MDVTNLLICYSFVIVFPIVVIIIVPRTSYINFFALEGLLWRIFRFLSKTVNKQNKEKYAQTTSSLTENVESEIIISTIKHSEEQSFYGIDQEGNSLLLRITLTKNTITTVYLHLKVQNNTYTLPVVNGILETNIPKNRWKVDGLNIEVVEPFKRLRICFNGILKTDRDTTDHIQFNFIFNASCSPFYYPSDIDDTIFRKFLLMEKVKCIFGSSSQPLLDDQIELIQFGVLKGLLRRNSSEEIELHLPTCRTRYKGIESKYVYNKVLYINAIDECGNSFHIGIKHFKNGSSSLVYGFSYLTAKDQRYPITSIHIEEFLSGKGNILPEYIIATAKANNKTFKINILIHKTEIQATKTSYKKGYAIYTAACGCNINENEGRACVEARYPFEGPNDFVPEKRLTETIVDSLPNILLCDIKDERSQIVDLTGGKGCSLALLASLHSSEFKVPDGFIITVNAYNLYIKGELVEEINLLSDVCCGKTELKLEEACNRTVKCFKNQKFPENLKEQIILQLQKYPKEHDQVSWAVRSSAIGEDSEELSSAGQNETFLGCQSYEQILEAIQACWASLYTYQSVQYRWQHGIPVVTRMAVVVQKMVKADSAGVLFTCHPSTCNPSQMVITSNFGLGETVVSGESDPDTYILNKRSNSIIEVESKVLGTKNKVLTLTKEGLQETTTQEDIFSLSDEQAIQLGKVGLLLEKAFGNPRDIEWGFHNGQLFLFQSRPITTLTTWTDYELSHELDFPQLTKLSACTTANIREVVPKASTVLSRTSSLRCLDWGIQKLVTCNFDPASMKALITYQHNVFLDVIKFEIMEETWNDNPSQVIAMIQANLGVERKEKDRMDIDKIIKNLKSPKSSITRLIVKFLLKKIRVAVGIREQTKSVLVLAVDKLRRAYRNLSDQMVLNGILPHKDLIYHLTHEEVKLLIKSRNPLLISKAMMRQKLYSKWKAMRFAEVMFGLPEPEKDEEDTEISDLKDMCKGTAVCRGIVQARACVIRNLDEISQLQKGDVLITYSTDIGWSPYFPMLSGVVTELGGLVSHGAVVAREYGLPCVVGVKNVLKYFKTGDKIYLNGNTGELGKL
ncbi:unnamed protein product [Diabrotica balteata]|uniref:Phosphoenolpyruvate synthase n=1 Tax=Diabrotica balteata TaxID=107213 RepID=A0A9N9X8K3_DIABA|nr:unnamed protein product [Diabrotica balteata]